MTSFHLVGQNDKGEDDPENGEKRHADQSPVW